jgi:hypothetical protein
VSQMTPEDGFRLLYPDEEGVFDITPRGFIDAMRKLRADNRALSERVQRAIGPAVNRALPRRTRHWLEMSGGRKTRFGMLPINPYLAKDVETIRQILGIPDDHVTIQETDPEWRRLSEGAKPGFERNQVEGILVGAWLQVHQGSVVGVPGSWPQLPQRFRTSAISSASIDLNDSGTPSWIGRDSTQHKSESDSDVPVMIAAQRLAERYADPSIVLRLHHHGK